MDVPPAHEPASAIALIAETREPGPPPAPLYLRPPDADPPRDPAPVERVPVEPVAPPVPTSSAPTGVDGCARGVATTPEVADGKRVKIVEIHPDDAYYDDRFSIAGRAGVTSGRLRNNGGCW